MYFIILFFSFNNISKCQQNIGSREEVRTAMFMKSKQVPILYNKHKLISIL